MDLDDLLDGIDIGSGGSRRVQGALRVLFGLLGTALCGAGVWYTLQYDASLHFRLAGALLFFFLAAFFLVNVTLRRAWSWPWKGVLAAFVLLFVARLAFGP